MCRPNQSASTVEEVAVRLRIHETLGNLLIAWVTIIVFTVTVQMLLQGKSFSRFFWNADMYLTNCMSSRDRIAYINLYEVLTHEPLCNQLRAEIKTTLVKWNIRMYMFSYVPIPVAARSTLACWDCGFESHTAARMPVCRECCALWRRGLCVGLITRLEESYRLCLWVWSRETITSIPTMRRQTEVKTKEWRSIWKGLVMNAKIGTYSPLCRMQAVRTWFQFYKGWSIQVFSNFKSCQLVQDNCLTRHTATHPKVFESSSTPLPKPQIIMCTCCHL